MAQVTLPTAEFSGTVIGSTFDKNSNRRIFQVENWCGDVFNAEREQLTLEYQTEPLFEE